MKYFERVLEAGITEEPSADLARYSLKVLTERCTEGATLDRIMKEIVKIGVEAVKADDKREIKIHSRLESYGYDEIRAYLSRTVLPRLVERKLVVERGEVYSLPGSS